MSTARHLKRLEAVWRNPPLYFVTTCVARRQPILCNELAYAALLGEWNGLRRRHGWAIGRYVVMPDHVHFFASPDPGSNVPLNIAIGRWKEWTAKRILKATDGSAPFWQPEFFDHLLRSKESLAEKWEYVRENPVRAGLVSRAEEWPYAGSVDFEG